jgi:tetratricopeptide (TPR) repeat protein
MMELRPGQRFGRYVIADRLGAGGMSVVYAAHDPDLDRPVALKLLAPEPTGSGSKAQEYTVRLDRDGNERDPARERVLAEGRALARLSHPNLVGVFEVGAVADQVFLAMELVAGPSLRGWLAAPERRRPDVLAAFAQAGRGLAAAHAAGLVHGDFKPENVVMESSTGRARVVDFGLARAAGTRAAGAFGTPRYMPPEQRAGRAIDARADQFAFAVALYEALHGRHPFEEEALSGGALGPPRLARGRLPRRVEAALARALSPDPDARFPSMDALLDRIAPRSGRRALVVAAAAAAILVSGAALAIALTSGGGEQSAPPCSGGPVRVAAVWGAPARAKLETAFAGSRRPYAAAAATRVGERFDRFARAWAGMHRDACLVAARGEQSPALLDRRMACLDRRLEQLRGRVALLSGSPDGTVVDRALDVADLEPLDACADAATLLGKTAPPVEPDRRAAAAELEAAIDASELALKAGRVDDAIGAARRAVDGAAEVAHPPLTARAQLALGDALEEATRLPDAEQAFHAALAAAERAGDDALTARILLELVSNVGLRQQRVPEARTLARLAEAAIGRAGDEADPDIPARLAAARAGIAYADGKAAEAADLYRQALEMRRELLPASDLRIASLENNLAAALDQQAKYDEARAHYRAALAIRQEVLGRDHPEVAKVHANLANSFVREGRHDDARSEFERALAVFSGIPGFTTATVREGLGTVETSTGHHAAAIRQHEAVLAERRERLGPDHPLVGTSLSFLGGAHYAAGELVTALRLDREGLAILRRALGETHPTTCSVQAQIGETLRALGRPRDAIVELEQALAALAKSVGLEHPRTIQARGYLAVARIDVGRPGDAIAELEHVLASVSESAPDNAVLRFGLARGLWPARRQRSRALHLARQAERQFAAGNQPHEVRRVRAWLARRSR